MYLNGMGVRGIERVTQSHHTTVMGWVKQAGLNLPDVPEIAQKPEITDLEELQSFVGNKRHKVGICTAVNHWQRRNYCLDNWRAQFFDIAIALGSGEVKAFAFGTLAMAMLFSQS